MIAILWVAVIAASAMVAQDVLATMLVQAENRHRRHLAGMLDAAQWLCGFVTTIFAVGSQVEHGWTDRTLVIVAFVTLANYVGTYIGVGIGDRYIVDEMARRVQRIEHHLLLDALPPAPPRKRQRAWRRTTLEKGVV